MNLAVAGPADTAITIALAVIVVVLWLAFRPRHTDEPRPLPPEEPRVVPYVPVFDWRRDDPDLSA